MTVGELISRLEDFDEDAKVVIGMEQRYGSDFMMEIDYVDEMEVDPWYEGYGFSKDDEKDDDVDGDDEYADDRVFEAVVITEGRQIGTVCYG